MAPPHSTTRLVSIPVASVYKV